MEARDAKELLHIRDWLQVVEEIVEAGEEKYLCDSLAREAGDSLMMKVGEAAVRLARSGLEAPADVTWSDAIVNRNWVIHQYDEIDRSVTWATLSQSMATWRRALGPLIEQAEVVLGLDARS